MGIFSQKNKPELIELNQRLELAVNRFPPANVIQGTVSRRQHLLLAAIHPDEVVEDLFCGENGKTLVITDARFLIIDAKKVQTVELPKALRLQVSQGLTQEVLKLNLYLINGDGSEKAWPFRGGVTALTYPSSQSNSSEHLIAMVERFNHRFA